MTIETPSHPPSLEERFQQPEGWRWHSFKNPQGRHIRFGTVAPQSRVPDAVVVVLQGLGEFTEKYFELARYLTANNMSFWMMDWQGQGKSDRHIEGSDKRHAHEIDEDVADLHYFIMEYIKHSAVHPDVGRIPMVMLAHSMGGNIGLHYLHRHNDTFACAAFSSPMMGISALKNYPAWFHIWLTAALKTFAGKSYVFGGTDWHPEIRDESIKALLSSDPARREVQDQWCLHDKNLRVGHVTFGWLHEANRACALLRKKNYLEDIKTPCLFSLAEHDHLVDNHAIRSLVPRIPNSKLLEFDGAGHEILFEKDEIRNSFLEAFGELLKNNKIKDKIKPF